MNEVSKIIKQEDLDYDYYLISNGRLLFYLIYFKKNYSVKYQKMYVILW